MKINELETGRRIGAGRNPVQDRGTGGAFSGNPPSPSITNKLGANGPAKTGTNVLKKAAAKTGFQSAIKSPATSMGDDNSDSQSMGDDDTSNASPTTGTTGTQSAQDMQNSSEETFDVMSGDKVPSIELTDLEVNIQPGSKKAELVSKDKQTKIEMSQEDLLARMQELSGIQQ